MSAVAAMFSPQILSINWQERQKASCQGRSLAMELELSDAIPMPIPELSAEGLLPEGVYDCTPAEVRERFGRFQESDRRPRLFARLEELVQVMGRSGLFEALVIDGSFITAKPAPNDIDLVAVLRPGHDFEQDLLMAQYALVSRPLLRGRFGFDVVLAEAGSPLYYTAIEFFSRVRESTHRRKGLLRVPL